MAHTCSECTYLKVNGETKYGKYWCESKGEWRFADGQECWNYVTAYSRSSSVARSAEEYSKDSQTSSSRCYITTALCEVLGMDDDNIYLNTLREFRNSYLQKNRRGLELLVVYDTIGPKICQKLKVDGEKFNISYILFNNYIVGAVRAIRSQNYEEAINIYTAMTNKLIKYYEIDEKIDVDINEVDPNRSGHGILQKKLAF